MPLRRRAAQMPVEANEITGLCADGILAANYRRPKIDMHLLALVIEVDTVLATAPQRFRRDRNLRSMTRNLESRRVPAPVNLIELKGLAIARFIDRNGIGI